MRNPSPGNVTGKPLKRGRILTSVLATLLAMNLLPGSNSLAADTRSILAIFAHPDDESTVAPILARYARQGVQVRLVIATDGRYGTNDHNNMDAGDELAALRRREMQCSANRLGVELVHLEYHDQLRAAEGYDGHIPHVRALLRDIHALIEDSQPDAIITWGPDGGSNHVDHRLVGATVTNAYLSRKRDKPISLFYYATPSDLIDDADDRVLRGVDRSYVDTSIHYDTADLQVAYEALTCHESQFSPGMLENWLATRKAGDMTIYLRKFATAQPASSDIFD